VDPLGDLVEVLATRILEVGPEEFVGGPVVDHRVLTVAGWIELTRIPRGASSWATDCINPTWPCLAAA
jgi:hypothetical protein